MGATSTSHKRRIENGDFEKFFKGHGIDIGCGNDPVTPTCEKWDRPQGDAQLMEGVASETFDWVYSSHCLEHMRSPDVAIDSWWKILKRGGFLIVVVPDWELYEQKTWPSRWNTDHKWAFTLDEEDFGHVIHVFDLILMNLNGYRIHRIQLNDAGYDYSLKGVDQTLKGAQAEIEIIIEKL